MRRIVVVAIAVVALLGALSPPASAQAPAPKVTLSGLMDVATVGGKNFNDSQYANSVDSAWWARQRTVFTVTGEVGKAKGVLALEIDLGWGQQSQNDSNVDKGGQAAFSSSSTVGTPQQAFHSGAFDLDTDVQGVIEIKSMYVEFPVPWIPFPTVTRLGGQPAQATLKTGVLFSGDFPGVWLSSTINPFMKFNFTFVQAEEQITGFRGSPNFTRGDDFAIIPTIDITPIKGVTVRPIYAYYSIQGNSSLFSRCRSFCAGMPGNGGTVTTNQFTGARTANASNLGNFRSSSTDDRHYFGIDAQMNFGPFFLDPTAIYQMGNVDVYRNTGGDTLTASFTQGTGEKVHQKTNSWMIDVRGGWRGGPLLLQGMVAWTPGDDAQHDSFKSSRVYNPIHTGALFNPGMQEIFSGGSVEYLVGSANQSTTNVGLGRYGLIVFGGKATYALTPAFSLNGKASSWWTDTKVDTDAPATATGGSFGAVPCAGPGRQAPAAGCNITADFRGDSQYLGTEPSVGFTYRFAPGLTFDAVYAHFFAGKALDSTFADAKTGVIQHRKSVDADLAAARVRYQF